MGIISGGPDTQLAETDDTLAKFAEPTGTLIGEAMGAPHSATTALLGLAGVPEHVKTPLESMVLPGEFGQVGAGEVPGEVNYPLREVAATMLDPLSYWSAEKGLRGLGRMAGLKLPGPDITGTVKGAEVFKEPGQVTSDTALQIKLAQEMERTKPTGMIAAEVTPVKPETGLVEKYGPAFVDKDIKRQIAGKMSTETPVWSFERAERQSGVPGLKDDIYWRQKQLEKAAKVEYTQVEKESRGVETALPKDAGKNIYTYAVGQQKGGPELLQKLGIAPVEELVGPEAAAYQQMRQGFDNMLGRWNEARVAVGKEPIEGVENYFTFIRKYVELVNKGGNPLTINPRYFKPLDVKVPYEIQRAQSNLPLVMDAFKVYRRYSKSVLDYIYQAPHTAEVRKLAEAISKTSPNTTEFLNNWTDQIMQLSKMKNRIFEGGSQKPTSWLGKSIDRTVNLVAGVRPIEEGFDRAFDKVVNNVGVSTLSGYLRSATIQPTSMVMTAGETGFKNLLGGIKDSASPAKWRYARENSNVLSTREFDINVSESIERMVSETKFGRFKKGAAEVGYAPLHYLDQQAAISTWWAAYRRGISSGMKPGDELFKYCDDVVTKTQGSAARSDLARIQTHSAGKALTQFQTFIINEWNYLTGIIPGLRESGMSFGDKMKKITRVATAGALANIVYEDVIGMPSPLPTPLRAGYKAFMRGEGAFGAAKAATGELSQVVPVFGGARYTGGSPLGPVAGFATDMAAAVKGEQGRVPLWTLPLRLRGVPGTVQLERLTRVPGKLSLGEALFGKMKQEKPAARPRRKSRSQVLQEQSYIKDLFPDLDLGF